MRIERQARWERYGLWRRRGVARSSCGRDRRRWRWGRRLKDEREKKRERESWMGEVEKKGASRCGEKDKIRHSQRFGSELEGARDRCVGLFPSLARDPALQMIWNSKPHHHHFEVQLTLVHHWHHLDHEKLDDCEVNL